MHIKIYKLVRDENHNIMAINCKINGSKYPKNHNGFYRTDSKIIAKKLALRDWLQHGGFNNET